MYQSAFPRRSRTILSDGETGFISTTGDFAMVSWWRYLCKAIFSVQGWTWHCFRSERKLDLGEDELRLTVKTVTHKQSEVLSHCFQCQCHEHHPGKCNFHQRVPQASCQYSSQGMGWWEEEGYCYWGKSQERQAYS